MDETQQLTERALERRVKRWLASGPFDCFIQSAPGLEPTLQAELASHDLGSGEAASGGVALQLDAAGIMRANLVLRSASRVLQRLGNFPAGSREMLYDRARRLPWELVLGLSGSYRLHMVSKASWVEAGDELARIVNDAIARRASELGFSARHDPGAELELHVRLLNNHATLSLNTSGEHLHRRGFRQYIGAAPLRETVAAALAMAAFEGHDLVLDPFCGSGTLLLELADIAGGHLAGRNRSFAFEQAAWFRPGLWREVQRQARAAAEAEGRPLQILGLDLEEKPLAAARRNLEAAGHTQVSLQRGDATSFDYSSLRGERRLVLANLPFGKRIGTKAEARRLHQSFLERLAESGGWDLGLLTTQPEVVRGFPGLELKSEQQVASGGLKMTMLVGHLPG